DPNYATYPKINIQIMPTYELIYPKSLAWENDWVTFTGVGWSGNIAYTNIEVNASGMLNGSPVTYGNDGVAAPQATWEKPSGQTESQYTWGYPDDDRNWGLRFSLGSFDGPDAAGRSWMEPSDTPRQRNLPSLYV